MSGFSIQIATFILLLFTTYLSIQTQIFQRRTSIRESIEQLDEHKIAHSVKLRPVVHEAKYRGPWSKTKIEIRARQFDPKGPSGISESRNTLLWWLNESERNDFCLALENLDDVIDAEWFRGINQAYLLVTFRTGDSVKVRKYTETVLDLIETSYENRKRP